MPTPKGEVKRDLAGGGLQAHTQGGVEGDLAGGVSRPTPKGEVEGDLARGVSRPTPGGVSIPACTEADPPPPMATATGGTHPTGMHSGFQDFFDTSRPFIYGLRSVQT